MAMLWHCILGHASLNYLKKFQSMYSYLKGIKGIEFDEAVKDCEVCKFAKIKRKPFIAKRTRASGPLERINADTMGPIHPVTFQHGFRYISVFIDNFSKLAMAYPMKSKAEMGSCLESFVKSCRNLLGEDAKVCYLEIDQGTEFTGGYTREVLDKLGGELRLACPDTPQHNGSAERFNQTIQNKTRAYMYDSMLPENSWDLTLSAAVCTYNRTVHASNEMQTPLQKFAPHLNFDINQIKRFGCLAYMKVQRNVGPKFRNVGKRVIFIGDTHTGYLLLMPEEDKFYESRDATFNEKLVYGDKYGKESIKNWSNDNEIIDENVWFKEFEKEEVSRSEGEPKRKRGRRCKNPKALQPNTENVKNAEKKPEENNIIQAFSTISESEREKQHQIIDESSYSLLAEINGDPKTFEEVMRSPEWEHWQKAVLAEISAMNSNHVLEIVNRPHVSEEGLKPNIIDSRWVFMCKSDENNVKMYKAGLVIRGFKDLNEYDLNETYAPISRIILVSSLLVIVNKYDLDLVQPDVKTAFLNRILNEEIYMEIPKGVRTSDSQNKVCKLKKALYGLRISPKKWNERFTESAEKTGLVKNPLDPCFFMWREGNFVVYWLLYLDDILLAGNNKLKLNQIKMVLKKEFEIKDLGEPREFLGIRITRDRSNKILEIDQQKFIEKTVKKFCDANSFAKSTSMMTSQARNKERVAREEDFSVSVNSMPDTFPLREAVGSLLYIANSTKPDISYSTNVLSRHQINPTVNELNILQRVMCYLMGTADKKLCFKGNDNSLQGYSDASLADCKGSLTTCGYVIKLFGDSIACKTLKANFVKLSTCEAEYVAMCLVY